MIPGFQADVPLAPHTTFQVGGPAAYFAVATTVAELRALVQAAIAAGQPLTILGGGSNVLVADAGVTGCVIKNQLRGWDVDVDGAQVQLTVGAGEVFDDVVAKTVAAGWWGLENLSHIPGSVGATPIQNVGAYGVEVADRLVSVTALHYQTGETKTFSATDCTFAYRDSWFKTAAGREWVVTSVTFALTTTPRPVLTYRDLREYFSDTTPTLADIRAAVIAIRGQKFPDWHQVGTAGSFFKNPIIDAAHAARLTARYPDLPTYPLPDGRVKVSLGWILDKICHLRGEQEGAVGTYAGQVLVLIQTGGATAADVTAFAERMAAAVYEATAITIEWEVTPIS